MNVEEAAKQAAESIAREMLSVPTLEQRGRDEKDFHELGVWGLREALITAAVAAHRERGSPFCALTAHEAPTDDEDDAPAWVQFSAPESLFNLDCTDAEYDRLTALLDDYPAFTVDAVERPEEAEGRHLRIEAYADDDRLAAFAEALFRNVYGYDADYRLWATEL